MRESILEDLDVLPAKIRDQDKILKRLDRDLKNIRTAKNAIKIRHHGQVARCVDKDDKPLFKNEKLREEEVNKRKKDDPDFQRLLDEEITAVIKFHEATIDFNFFKDRFSSAKYKAILLGGKIE